MSDLNYIAMTITEDIHPEEKEAKSTVPHVNLPNFAKSLTLPSPALLLLTLTLMLILTLSTMPLQCLIILPFTMKR
jgi:hypothetical protein